MVAGLEEAALIFRHIGCDVMSHTKDRDKVEVGKTFLTIEGLARNILTGERTALNLDGGCARVQHLTGLRAHFIKFIFEKTGNALTNYVISTS